MKYLLFLLVLTACNNGRLIIVCDGNSLTSGVGASKSYPQQLQELFKKATVYNLGVGAQTTEQMISDASKQVDSYYNNHFSCFLIAWEIGNDIVYNGHPEDAVKRFEQYCRDRKQAGWKVLALTLPQRGKTIYYKTVGEYQRALDSANILLRQNPSFYCDALVDVAADSRLSKINSDYWNYDSVHLNDRGYAVIAELTRKSILKLENSE